MRIPLDMCWAIEETARQKLEAVLAGQVKVEVQAAAATDPREMVGNVAVISITGIMTKASSIFQDIFGGTSTRQAQLAVEASAMDSKVRAIVLRLDSPGGSVDGLDQLGDAVFKAREQKPVIAQVDGLAASAAYYVASQATKIYSGRMDMVGSIGTRIMLYDFSRLFKNEGIEAVPIDTGKFKSAGAMGVEITDEQKADFQRIVNAYYNDFLAAIKRGRPMTMPAIRKVADGRVFLASEALELGLIDGIQPIEKTLRQLQPRSQRRRNVSQQRLAELDDCEGNLN